VNLTKLSEADSIHVNKTLVELKDHEEYHSYPCVVCTHLFNNLCSGSLIIGSQPENNLDQITL
jgi:hypothetical protein